MDDKSTGAIAGGIVTAAFLVLALVFVPLATNNVTQQAEAIKTPTWGPPEVVADGFKHPQGVTIAHKSDGGMFVFVPDADGLWAYDVNTSTRTLIDDNTQLQQGLMAMMGVLGYGDYNAIYELPWTAVENPQEPTILHQGIKHGNGVGMDDFMNMYWVDKDVYPGTINVMMMPMGNMSAQSMNMEPMVIASGFPDPVAVNSDNDVHAVYWMDRVLGEMYMLKCADDMCHTFEPTYQTILTGLSSPTADMCNRKGDIYYTETFSEEHKARLSVLIKDRNADTYTRAPITIWETNEEVVFSGVMVNAKGGQDLYVSGLTTGKIWKLPFLGFVDV